MKQRRLDNSGVYKTTTVIVPNRKQLKRGTLAGIIRQSGLPKDLFSR